MAKRKKTMKLGGILLALGATGVAVFYSRQIEQNFELPEAHRPHSDSKVYFRYIKKTKSYSGKKSRANCYILYPYNNALGERVNPGCVPEYHYRAVCELARKCKKAPRDMR